MNSSIPQSSTVSNINNSLLSIPLPDNSWHMMYAYDSLHITWRSISPHSTNFPQDLKPKTQFRLQAPPWYQYHIDNNNLFSLLPFPTIHFSCTSSSSPVKCHSTQAPSSSLKTLSLYTKSVVFNLRLSTSMKVLYELIMTVQSARTRRCNRTATTLPAHHMLQSFLPLIPSVNTVSDPN